MPRDTREPQEILDHIIKARVALTSLLYGLSEADLVKEGPVGYWSIKDVMAHIGNWEDVCFEELQTHLRGEKSTGDYRDAEALNDVWEERLRALSLSQSIELFEFAHQRLFMLLSSLRPEQWNGYVRAWAMGSTWHHFEEHAAQIRAWREGRPG